MFLREEGQSRPGTFYFNGTWRSGYTNDGNLDRQLGWPRRSGRTGLDELLVQRTQSRLSSIFGIRRSVK